MKQLTIRDVDVELHSTLRKEASRRGLSINRYVLSILREAHGLGNGNQALPVEFTDLDHLAGTWTEQEYAEFEKQLATQRGIDEDLWR